ncbi:aldehyde ferredoxin oxidoreductase family protein [Chloroflexota bacterium]
MGMAGYSGKILKVDLTAGNVTTQDLDHGIARDFIGDFGVNARLAYDLIEPGTDPLSPNNAILIGAGPLVGTRLQAPRCTVLTKMPLTGAIAFASGGMDLSRRLKYAGYDHLIITGRATRPVYLRIFDDNIEICDARHLWGKDILQTTDELWDKYGKSNSITSIGQAGENGVRIALALIDRISTVGKGGLGAVMGSKNLKAIVINGTKRVKVADPERFRVSTDRLLKSFKEELEYRDFMDNPDLLRRFGKMAFFDHIIKNMWGGVPYKNYTEIYPADEAVERYGTKKYLDTVNRRPMGCRGCTYHCKECVDVQEGEYTGLRTYISSPIGRVWDLGIRCGVDSIDKVIKCFDLANRYGICCHVFSPVMDLAVDLYERGIITKEDTEGMVLKRDFETTKELIEKIAFRQGIGDILADGSPGIINKFGQECEKYSTHIKGLNAQIDPRGLHFTMAGFGQIVNPEGGTGKPGHSFDYRVDENFSPDKVKTYCKMIGVPKEAVNRILDVSFGYNSARLTRYAEDFYSALTCLGICDHRTNLFNYDLLAEFYSAATGIEMSPDEMREAAERSWNMFKMLNVREGFSRKDDRIPPKWLEPLKTPAGEELPVLGCENKILTANDLSKLLDDYYSERGWDIARGIPTEEKLLSLGLDFMAEDLEN